MVIFDRKLLTKLSRCAWKVLNLYLTQAVPYDDAKPGAAVAVQSFGDFQNFHPHLHILATDGCFCNEGAFIVCPPPDSGELEALFRYEVFKFSYDKGYRAVVRPILRHTTYCIEMFIDTQASF